MKKQKLSDIRIKQILKKRLLYEVVAKELKHLIPKKSNVKVKTKGGYETFFKNLEIPMQRFEGERYCFRQFGAQTLPFSHNVFLSLAPSPPSFVLFTSTTLNADLVRFWKFCLHHCSSQLFTMTIYSCLPSSHASSSCYILRFFFLSLKAFLPNLLMQSQQHPKTLPLFLSFYPSPGPFIVNPLAITNSQSRSSLQIWLPTSASVISTSASQQNCSCTCLRSSIIFLLALALHASWYCLYYLCHAFFLFLQPRLSLNEKSLCFIYIEYTFLLL